MNEIVLHDFSTVTYELKETGQTFCIQWRISPLMHERPHSSLMQATILRSK